MTLCLSSLASRWWCSRNKAVPSMMLENALQPKGTFWFFFGVAFLGLLWAFFLLPETSHRNLEETSEMIS